MRFFLCLVFSVPIFVTAQTPLLSFLVPHKSGAKFFEFSNDSKFLLTIGKYDNTAKVWDVSSGKILTTLTGENLNQVNTQNKKQLRLDFIPVISAKFITGTNDVIYFLSGRNSAAIWEASTGKIRQINFPDSCRILSLFTIPSKTAQPVIGISCIGSGNLIISDFNGKNFKTVKAQKKPLLFSVLSNNAHYLAIESIDSVTKVFNTTTWLPEIAYKSSKGFMLLSFSNKEDMVVMKAQNKSGLYMLWSLKSRKKIYESKQTLNALLSDNGKFIYDVVKDSFFVTEWGKDVKTGKKTTDIYRGIKYNADNPFVANFIVSAYPNFLQGSKPDEMIRKIQNITHIGSSLSYVGIDYMNWSVGNKYFGIINSGNIYLYNTADWSELPFTNKNPFYDDIKVWNYSDGILQIINSRNSVFTWDIKTNKRKDDLYKYNIPPSLSPLAQSAGTMYRNRRLTPSITYIKDSAGKYDVYLLDEETIIISDYKTKNVYATLQLSGKTRLESLDYKRSMLIFTVEAAQTQKTKLCILKIDDFIRNFSSLQITFGWVYEDEVKGYRSNGENTYLTMDMIAGILNVRTISNVSHSLNHLFTHNFDFLVLKRSDFNDFEISKTEDGYFMPYATIKTASEPVSFATSDDDKLLVYSVAQYSGPVIWNIESKKPVKTLDMPERMDPYFLNSEIFGLTFSHDKQYIIGMVLQAQHERQAIFIWNTATGKLIKVINDLDIDYDFSLNSSNNNLVYTSVDGSTHIYNLDESKSKILLYNTRQLSNLIRFSEDGKYLISYYGGVNTIFGDAETFKQKLVIEGTDFKFINADNIVSFDGTFFNVYNIDTGLRYRFVILDTASSICFDPENFYSLPKAVADICYYVSGNKIINLQQLDTRYNRPDKILEAMSTADTALISLYRKAYEKRMEKLRFDTSYLTKDYKIPEADFENRNAIAYQQASGTLGLHIKGKNAGNVLDRFNIWVNDVPLYGLKGISIRNKHTNIFDTTVRAMLSEGENKIETSVTNINGIESYRSPLYVKYTPAVHEAEKTYFLGIGIDRFADAQHNLQWSTKDIRDIAGYLKVKLKTSLEIDTLLNEEVTVKNIKALKQKLQHTTVNDKIIIAYSGHGLLSKDYNYFLSTYGINFNDPVQNGLPYDELENLLDSIPARKKLMLIDACHSGEIDKAEMQRYVKAQQSLNQAGIIKSNNSSKGTEITNKDSGSMKNSFELMQELFVNVGKNTGATVISAATGTQLAKENNTLKNGIFTYSILEYMQQHDHTYLSKLKQYVNRRVPELTQGLQVPTSRSETIGTDWNVW